MLNSASNTRVVIPVALRALEAQRLVNLIAFKANPAMAAGLIAYVHMGEVGSALLVAAAMLGALQLVERSTLPLGLMPAARLGVAPLRAGARRRRRRGARHGGGPADGVRRAPGAGGRRLAGHGAWGRG